MYQNDTSNQQMKHNFIREESKMRREFYTWINNTNIQHLAEYFRNNLCTSRAYWKIYLSVGDNHRLKEKKILLKKNEKNSFNQKKAFYSIKREYEKNT